MEAAFAFFPRTSSRRIKDPPRIQRVSRGARHREELIKLIAISPRRFFRVASLLL